MDAPVDTYHPIMVYFTKIDDTIQLANNGKTPLTTRQYLRTGLLAVMNTGEYKDECKQWEKNAEDKMWSNLKTLFENTYHKLKQQ